MRKRLVIILAVLITIFAAIYAIRLSAAGNGEIQGSGTIEAVEIDLAAELSGRLAEILVEKGQAVKKGELLFRLDGELLQAQHERAAAAVQVAQANLATAQAGLSSAEAALATAQASAEAERLVVQKSLDDLYVNAPAARGEAARNVAIANRAVRDAVYQLDNYSISSLQEDLAPSEGISMTKKLLDEARLAFEPYRYESLENSTREDLKEALDSAQSEYDSAVRRIELVAALEAAQSRLSKAEEDLSRLQDGPNPQEVAILEARLAAVEAGVRQVESARDTARVGVQTAEAQAAQVQAELNLIDVQISKLSVASPTNGVVLKRIIEAGEVVQVGSPVVTIGQLAQLKITVYLPEDRYGAVTLGQVALVTVDSFPGQQFQARVTSIADQAEFTPRNVQTVEGRRTTVFAIELVIDNTDGRLKPGMPADVRFEE